MKSHLKAAAGLLALAALPATAADFKPLSQACEEALALSALPAALRDQASVYVWRNGAFEKTIESDGSFHCVVERNHPDSIIPECVTDTGKDTILAGIEFKTQQTALGLTSDEITDRMKQRFASGALAAPARPGINYMMSAYNYIYIERANEIRTIPPHTMFFAPDVPESVIGQSYDVARQNPGTPMVTASGPHGYMITFTAAASDPTQVVQACEGQVDTRGWQAATR